MLTYELQIRVRYCDTDAMGVVHHSQYVNYYEAARTEMLRSIGATYRELEAAGVMLPVHEVRMNYFSPARYDDLLTVRLTMREMPGVRMTFDHEVLSADGALINTGRITLVFMNAATRRACRAPEWFLGHFERFFAVMSDGLAISPAPFVTHGRHCGERV